MLTVYTTTWCGDCRRLEAQLDQEGIAYLAVDIERDPAAERLVLALTGGVQTIPTVVFDDGSALVEPTIVEVKDHLAGSGGDQPA